MSKDAFQRGKGMQQSSGQRWGRGGLHSDWIQICFEWKLMTVSYSRAVSSGILHMSRHSFTDAIHSEMSMKVCIVLCVCVRAKAWVIELSLHAASLPKGFSHFKSPSSPWMVFLMRSRRVVCHWSRREIESNSLTCNRKNVGHTMSCLWSHSPERTKRLSDIQTSTSLKDTNHPTKPQAEAVASRLPVLANWTRLKS